MCVRVRTEHSSKMLTDRNLALGLTFALCAVVALSRFNALRSLLDVPLFVMLSAYLLVVPIVSVRILWDKAGRKWIGWATGGLWLFVLLYALSLTMR